MFKPYAIEKIMQKKTIFVLNHLMFHNGLPPLFRKKTAAPYFAQSSGSSYPLQFPLSKSSSAKYPKKSFLWLLFSDKPLLLLPTAHFLFNPSAMQTSNSYEL